MDRRGFLQGIAATAAGLEVLTGRVGATTEATPVTKSDAAQELVRAPSVPVEGYTFLTEFRTHAETWKVYEDLRTREGALVFVSSTGATRSLAKSAEASMPETTSYYLGLTLKEVGLSSADLLADRLLQNGDPDPDAVRSVAPPMASAEKNPRTWTTFVGTKEAYDVTPVYRSGNTKTCHPIQYSPQLRGSAQNRTGLRWLGWWLDAGCSQGHSNHRRLGYLLRSRATDNTSDRSLNARAGRFG
jgi:hypothetical protein